MATVITATCTPPDGCGWTGGPYQSEAMAWRALRGHSCHKHRTDTERRARGEAARAAIDRTPKPCQHKRADHEHGTYAAYVLDLCRCTPCARANAVYERRRVRQTAYGRWQPYVPADPARQHVRALMAAGIGLKRVAALSGISNGVLWKLLYGVGDRAPSRTIRPATEAKLLAVTTDQHAAGAKIPALGTRRRLQALACLGWSINRLAEHADLDRQPLDHALHGRGQDLVLRRTADAVTALHDELWNTPAPAEDQRSRISVSRTKTRAQRAGWQPPLAWDDIDDPCEQPQADPDDVDPRTARSLALVEDLTELAEQGLTLDQACHRLGVGKDKATVTLRRHAPEEGRPVRDRFLRNTTLRDLGRTA